MANSTNLFSEITIDCFHEYWGGEYYDLYACFIDFFFFNRIVQDSRNKNLEASLQQNKSHLNASSFIRAVQILYLVRDERGPQAF